MTTCISHWTALHWHLRRVCWSSVMASDGDEPRVPDVGPTAAEVADVVRALEPYLPEVPGRAPSIDVLVSSDRGRRKIAGVTSHVCSTPLPRGSIQPTGLRGYDIAVTSPELTFIQIAATEDLRVHLMTRREVLELLRTNRIRQALMAAPLWRYFAEYPEPEDTRPGR